MTHGETAPADDCLSAPKAETPPGSHWRYRVDHANKRNCWYLRSEGGLSQAATQNTSPAPSAPSAAKPSVADARAELRAQSGREDSPAVSPPAAASSPANAPRSAPWPANPSTGAATAAPASRWPDPVASSSPVPSSGGSDGTANPADDPPQAASANLPDAAAASAPADPPTPIHLGIIPGLIAAAIGALAFAGAAAALIARRRRVRLPRHRKMSRARAPIWETTDDDRIVLEDHPPWDRDFQPRFGRSVGSTKIQPAKAQSPTRAQPANAHVAKAHAAKIQSGKVQAGKVQAADVRGDRRTEFPPRMPRSASR
jgi:hypothetical protein